MCFGLACSVLGTVTFSTATDVTTGSGGTDTSVAVAVGGLAGASGETVIITFDATIDNPLPNGVIEVRNQGSVSASNAAAT